MASNSVSNKRKPGNGRKQADSDSSTGSVPDESRRDYESLGDEKNQGESYIARGTAQVRELTRNHEMGAVAMAAVAGFGIGVLVGAALATSHRKPRTWRDRIMAEGLGQRFMEHIENMMPEMLVERMRR